MTCSIIIRAFNEEAHIGKLLNGIKQQETHTDLEVILVDSGSKDKTVQIAESYGTKIVRIRPEEFSFGRALNLGCQHASGDILLFASAHVYPVYTNWIDQMLKPFEDPKVALSYGRQIGNHQSKYSEQQLFAKWFPAVSNYNQQIPFCNNANTAIRRSLWEELPYDETLTGLEDLHWASEILQRGYRIAYDADATIVHVHEETPRKVFNRYYREAIAFKRLKPMAKFSLWDFAYLSVSNLMSDYVTAIQERVFWKHITEIPVFRILQFWGTYQGYRFIGTLDRTLRERFYYPNEVFRREKPATQEPLAMKQIAYE
ncbi:glycosyltransferase involved in cell wall biosynthesis [Larkinella arboricola]|uniref:Glycosyltransferase involved in cell wall biosynthesis n=1 Tax=Larkinella arboricola TaxID=643671 RepID=A0A327XEA9_LARAB|nr:glycosyltransferase [Larkinella arboricola]RAK02566.1 glycosyltransferase involved in cell wall biosynthesis [Larkinella arboricola]